MESGTTRPEKTIPKEARQPTPIYPPGLAYPPGYGPHFALANFHLYSLYVQAQQAQAAQNGLLNWPFIHHANPLITQSSSRTATTDSFANQTKSVDETTGQSIQKQSNEENSNSSNSATESLLAASECHMAVCKDEDGDTPLHIAIVHQNTKLIQKLIGLITFSKLTVNTPNHLSQTALHLAILTNQPQVVQQLIEAGADALMQDRHGQTALHLCAEKGDLECLTEIMNSKKKWDLEIKNFEGMTPLHLAVQKKKVPIIKALVQYGAKINAKDGKSGHTPLHHAIDHEHSEILQFLVSRGANINEPNFSGITPLQNANSCRNEALSKIILSQETASSSSATLVRPNVIQKTSTVAGRYKGGNQTSVTSVVASTISSPAVMALDKRKENEKKFSSSQKRKAVSSPATSKRSKTEILNS